MLFIDPLENVDFKAPNFAEVQLGPFESQIKDMNLRKDPGDPTMFTTFIWRYGDDIGSTTMIGALGERERWDGASGRSWPIARR